VNGLAPSREIPPPLEMLCLKALWSIEQGNVHDVQRVLAGKRQLAYTTVMTVLDRLAKKQVVTRRKAGRAFLYTPAISRESMCRLAIDEFIECFFDGSRAQLLAFLGNDSPGSAPPVQPSSQPAEETGLDPVLL